MLGYQITIDARGCDKAKLNDLALFTDILSCLPKAIDKLPIGGWVWPHLNGVSGMKHLALGGGIMFHTFSSERRLVFSVFCSQEFDLDYVSGYVTKTFGAKSFELHMPIHSARL